MTKIVLQSLKLHDIQLNLILGHSLKTLSDKQMLIIFEGKFNDLHPTKQYQMEKHMNLSDDEFENKFAACALDPNDFTHEAHIRLAWIHITRYGLQCAEQTIQKQLKAFVVSVGAENKYHSTMTIAAVKAVHHFIEKSRNNNFSDFVAEFPRLTSDFIRVIDQHYSYNIFKSTKARNSFVEPDLLPFN